MSILNPNPNHGGCPNVHKHQHVLTCNVPRWMFPYYSLHIHLLQSSIKGSKQPHDKPQRAVPNGNTTGDALPKIPSIQKVIKTQTQSLCEPILLRKTRVLDPNKLNLDIIKVGPK